MRKFFKRQRGLFQIYWRVGRREFILITSALIAIPSFAIEWNKWFTVSFVLAAVGIGCTVMDFRRLKRESAEYQLVERPNFQQELSSLVLSTRYSDWKKYKGRHGTAWYDPRVNRILSEQSFPLQIEVNRRTFRHPIRRPARFELPERLRKFERFILFGQARDHLVYNEQKIRISTDPTFDSIRRDPTITIERTTYYDSLCTIDFAPSALQQRSESSVALSGIKIVSSNGILLDLSEPDLSNHVGGSTLAFTSDDYLVIQRQSKLTRQSAGRSAPSGSGSLDWKDTRNASTLAEFVKTGLRRELVEETGLPKRVKLDLEIIGLVRHAHRGGQVEFFGIARLPVKFRQLYVSKREKLFVFDHIDDQKCRLDSPSLLVDEIRQLQTKLLNDQGTDLSFPLEIALHLFIETLIERPEFVGRVLGIDQWVRQQPGSVA